MKKISIQIITYNSEKWIKKSLDSVFSQTRKPIEVLVIDNGSTDLTIELIKTHFPMVRIIENNYNAGFAKAHNLGFRHLKGDYVVVLNPDIILSADYIDEIVKSADKDENIGMVTGKLYRITEDFKLTNILDSTGLIILKNRRVYDRDQGKVDKNQFNRPDYVFGCSGAAVLYRRKMLEDIKIGDEYFDEDFFIYKEDVDLAWRAQLLGWKCFYTPRAVAYHARGWDPDGRKRIPREIQIHSLKNRYLMLLKNDSVGIFLKHLPWIITYEILILMHNLVKTPYLFKVWPKIFHLLAKTWAKRKQIMAKKVVSNKYMIQWFR